MGEIWIDGEIPLSGQVQIQGSKNAALPMMAAALLHDGVTILHRCPRIADVYAMEKILISLGVKTSWEQHTLTLDCRKIRGSEIIGKYAESMRSSVILMGSMLSRMQKVRIGYPGGCTIGKRPIDLHLKVFQTMGVRINEDHGELLASCETRMKGADIEFPFSSVGATENGLLAAVKAKGTTRLRNCAAEPEIYHLCRFLQ
ncbi:MAG: UDP-N-acetylglucosamine 1-carboxyvinyltransferase, partial [Oliverpabstia sp.]